MSILYDLSVPVFLKYLSNLEGWIDQAVDHAKDRGFDPEVLMQARLGPDMFPFVRQIGLACDAAKYAAAKLAGQEAPSHPDTETTIEEVRARLKTVAEYLEGFSPEDFEGAGDRRIEHTWMQGQSMRGADYLAEFALANFFFHVVTAYDILRHNGVKLGKISYIGSVTLG